MKNRGYTLVELMVAVGLFAIVMLLASGAYLIMIGLNRQVQGISSGINNLSFALEAMARDIRTGTTYSCGGGGDCQSGASTFSFTNKSGAAVAYTLSGSALQRTINSAPTALTDSSSVTISSLTFYAFGTAKNDGLQPRVTIIVSGTVAGKTPQPFTVETSATMRGSDI